MVKYTLIFLILLLGAACNGIKDDGSKEVKFDTFKKDTLYHLSSSVNSPYLEVSALAEIPVSCPNKVVLLQMQKLISSIFIGYDTVSLAPSSILNQYVQKCVNDYKSLEKEYSLIKDTLTEGNIVPNSFNWKITMKGSVTFSENGIVCYQAESQSNMERTQHSVYIRSININVKEGRIIGLNDLFIDDYESILTPCIIDKLKLQFRCDSLSSNGFFEEDEICPSQNFSIDDKGITFIYNPGDIALNGLGIIKVKLDYPELVIALKQNTIIRDFIKE